MKIPKPTLGRIVMYRKYLTYGGGLQEPRPAMIIGLGEASYQETVDLLVFNSVLENKKTARVDGIDYGSPDGEYYHDIWFYPEHSDEMIEVDE